MGGPGTGAALSQGMTNSTTATRAKTPGQLRNELHKDRQTQHYQPYEAEDNASLAGILDTGADDGTGDGLSDSVVFSRVESLMGSRLHLHPERIVKPPRIAPDDDVAQVVRKMMRYTAATQDVSDLTDDEVAALMGLEADLVDETEPGARGEKWALSTFNGDPEDRVVVGRLPGSTTKAYVSCGSTFKKTGSYRDRRNGEEYEVVNLGHRMTVADLVDRFAEAHPEHDRGEIDRLGSWVEQKHYSGKGYKHLFSTSPFGTNWGEATTLKAAIANERGVPIPAVGEGIEGVDIESMDPAEARRVLMDAPGMRREADADGNVWVWPEGRPFNRAKVDSIVAALEGRTQSARRARLCRDLREFAVDTMQCEVDYHLQRKYVRDNDTRTSARVFEQKKNVPQSHVDAAEQSPFKQSGAFRHVEFDADCDLDKLDQVGREYADIAEHLPRTPVSPAFRARKLGRHSSTRKQVHGIYHPHVHNIAVDVRDGGAASFIHEYIHHVDFTAGERNISSSEEFRPLLRKVQQAASTSGSKLPLEYLTTPTECLSRTAEAYFAWKGAQTSLNGDPEKYATEDEYRCMEPLREEIIAFWDAKLTELGATPPEPHTHRA